MQGVSEAFLGLTSEGTHMHYLFHVFKKAALKTAIDGCWRPQSGCMVMSMRRQLHPTTERQHRL